MQILALFGLLLLSGIITWILYELGQGSRIRKEEIRKSELIAPLGEGASRKLIELDIRLSNYSEQELLELNSHLFPKGLYWFRSKNVSDDGLLKKYPEKFYNWARRGERWDYMPLELFVGCLLDKELVRRNALSLLINDKLHYAVPYFTGLKNAEGLRIFSVVIVDLDFSVCAWYLWEAEKNSWIIHDSTGVWLPVNELKQMSEKISDVYRYSSFKEDSWEFFCYLIFTIQTHLILNHFRDSIFFLIFFIPWISQIALFLIYLDELIKRSLIFRLVSVAILAFDIYIKIIFGDSILWMIGWILIYVAFTYELFKIVQLHIRMKKDFIKS